MYTKRAAPGAWRAVPATQGTVRPASQLFHGGPTPEFYTPQPPSYHGMTVVMQTQADLASLIPTVRAQVRALVPDAQIYNVRTLDYLLDLSVADARFRTQLLACFAALGLLLTVVGTYSVISLLVTQRSHEMGIRLALGARSRDIFRLVVRGGMVPLATGAVLGIAGSGDVLETTPASATEAAAARSAAESRSATASRRRGHRRGCGG